MPAVVIMLTVAPTSGALLVSLRVTTTASCAPVVLVRQGEVVTTGLFRSTPTTVLDVVTVVVVTVVLLVSLVEVLLEVDVVVTLLELLLVDVVVEVLVLLEVDDDVLVLLVVDVLVEVDVLLLVEVVTVVVVTPEVGHPVSVNGAASETTGLVLSVCPSAITVITAEVPDAGAVRMAQ